MFELNADLPSPCAVSYVRFAHSVRLPMQKKIPFGIYLSILLGILRKSLLFRKEAKPTKSKRRLLAAKCKSRVLPIWCAVTSFASLTPLAHKCEQNPFRDFAFAYLYCRNYVRRIMQKKIPFGILLLHIYIAVTSFASLTPLAHNAKKNPFRDFVFAYGAPSGIRTRDPLIKSQLLYQLS